MKMKGADLKNCTAAPEKSRSPIHPVLPNATRLLSTVIGFLPGAVQLTSRELNPAVRADRALLGYRAEGWVQSAPSQQQATMGSVHRQSQHLEHEALLQGRSAASAMSPNCLALTLGLQAKERACIYNRIAGRADL